MKACKDKPKRREKRQPKTPRPSYVDFDSKRYHWKSDVNYRENWQHYRVGKGEQGVLLCEPYKSEILPLWRFKTPEIAAESSQAIYEMFLAYLKRDDFVGADMARKFLQMGYTRSRRYANYKGGKKYRGPDYEPLPRGTGDPLKAESAKIFYEKWKIAERNEEYAMQKKKWKQQFG